MELLSMHSHSTWGVIEQFVRHLVLAKVADGELGQVQSGSLINGFSF